MLLPNVGDLLPDVDNKIQLGVLQRIEEVSIPSFYASSSSTKPLCFNEVLLCSACRMWATRLVTVCKLARLSCRHQNLWTSYTGASWRAIRNSMAGRSVYVSDSTSSKY
jgi:hypothetical protein